MADLKISALPAAGVLSGAELLAIVQGGVTAKTSIAVMLANYVSNSTTAGGELAGTYPNPTLVDSAVVSKVLTGYVSGSGTVSATDSILQAIQKLNGNIALVSGAVVYQGLWNATTNSPALVSSVGTKGYMYKVSVAGSTNLDGISTWNVGDQVMFDGTTWDKLEGLPNEVISVNGNVGVVPLTGTANRLTVSAGNVFDISATFEALLGKVANPLSQFAATTSAQLAGVISDETGSGFVVFSVSPALTGSPTAPTQTAGDNSTKIATTAYVETAIGDANDLMTQITHLYLTNR